MGRVGATEARLIRNQLVVGSIPSPGPIKKSLDKHAQKDYIEVDFK